MGARDGMDGCEKSRPPPPGFDSRTDHPVANGIYITHIYIYKHTHIHIASKVVNIIISTV